MDIPHVEGITAGLIASLVTLLGVWFTLRVRTRRDEADVSQGERRLELDQFRALSEESSRQIERFRSEVDRLTLKVNELEVALEEERGLHERERRTFSEREASSIASWHELMDEYRTLKTQYVTLSEEHTRLKLHLSSN